VRSTGPADLFLHDYIILQESLLIQVQYMKVFAVVGSPASFATCLVSQVFYPAPYSQTPLNYVISLGGETKFQLTPPTVAVLNL